MGRDGHRAAQEKDNKLGFCFALASSLNSRKDFDSFFLHSLHTRGGIYVAPDLVGLQSYMGNGAGREGE